MKTETRLGFRSGIRLNETLNRARSIEQNLVFRFEFHHVSEKEK